MHEPTPFDAWQMDHAWNEERKRREERDLARMIRTGDMDCSVCGKPYRKHPRHPRWDFMHEICDGSLVKL
jgi:hypothetical protein